MVTSTFGARMREKWSANSSSASAAATSSAVRGVSSTSSRVFSMVCKRRAQGLNNGSSRSLS